MLNRAKHPMLRVRLGADLQSFCKQQPMHMHVSAELVWRECTAAGDACEMRLNLQRTLELVQH
jgi:hypothetical protein